MADGKIPEEFEVGTPVLVCRWRLQDGALPIENRHLRALGRRHVLGKKLSRQLLAWAKQHIEWTLADGTAEHPDGVLMLLVDAEGRAAMACGDYEPLPDTTLAGLLARAASGSDEASETDIAPETIWVGRGRGLAVGMAPGEHPSGAASLVEDLAKTLGMPVERDPPMLPRSPPRRSSSRTSTASSPRLTRPARWRGSSPMAGTACSSAPAAVRTKGDGLLWSRPVRCRRDQVNPSPLAPDAAGTR